MVTGRAAITDDPLVDFLAVAGGAVAGGGAIAATLTWAAITLINDHLPPDDRLDRREWAERAGALGSIFGMAAVCARAAGVS